MGTTGGLLTVVAPETAGLSVATEIEGCELDVADGEFFRGWVQCGLQDGDAVVLEHVEQRCLAGIVEAEEEEFGVLVCEAQRGQDFPDCALCQYMRVLVCSASISSVLAIMVLH